LAEYLSNLPESGDHPRIPFLADHEATHTGKRGDPPDAVPQLAIIPPSPDHHHDGLVRR
jgi:hypothetical protein